MRSLVCGSPRTSLSPCGITTTVRRPGIKRSSVPPTASVRFNNSTIGDVMGQLRTMPDTCAVWQGGRKPPADLQPFAALHVDVDHGAALFVDHTVPIGRDARIGPFEQPGRVRRRQVHAAVTSNLSEIVVPIGAVQREAFVKIL